MNMITHNNGERKYLLIEVPEEGYDFRISNAQCDADLICTMPDKHLRFIKSLDSYNYLFIGKASELTEEQWMEIIEDVGLYGAPDDPTAWVDYASDFGCFYTATESGLSLIRFNKLSPTTTLILQKP
jgi:hypothetical protein